MKKLRFNRLGWFFLVMAMFGLYSCSLVDPTPPKTNASGNYSTGFWIINEGLFGAANASLDFYHTDKDTLETNVFGNVNQVPLGDILQNMVHLDNKYFLVVNTSNIVIVVDDKTFKTVSIIPSFILPRYFAAVSAQKAYLTSETGEEISVIDLQKLTKSGSIKYDPKPSPDSIMASWTEQLAVIGNNAYVTAVKTGELLVINTQTDKITDTIPLSIGAKNVMVDKEGKLWVLCDGTLATPNIHSALYCVDPATQKTISTFIFPDTKGAGNLTLSPTGDTLYYVYGGIYKMGIHQGSLPISPIVPALKGSDYWYGLGIDPKTNTIYAADPLDFQQAGIIFQYTVNGKLLKSHRTGVGPNGFLFLP